MAVSKERKNELIVKFGGNAKNTGSIEAQIAILTEDINILTPHFKANHKDNHSRRGFLAKIQKRKDLLKYLKAQDFNKYQALIKELGLRK